MNNLAYKEPILNNHEIRKDSTLDNFLENILLKYYNQIQSNYYSIQNIYDPEILHQMRVSLRRYKSLVNFFKKEINNNERIKVNKVIQKLLKPTSKVRDFDVINQDFISRAYRNNADNEKFKLLSKYTEDKKSILHTQMLDKLASSRYQKLLNELHNWVDNKKWRKTLSDEKQRKTNKSMEDLVNKILHKKHKKILKGKIDIFSYKQKDLHKLRVNIKELRYAVDELGIFINHKKHELEFLKCLQNILGEINDSYIAERVLNELSLNQELDETKKYIKNQAHILRTKNLLRLDSIYKKDIN